MKKKVASTKPATHLSSSASKRSRAKGGRDRVLQLLASGPRTASELVAKGGFSSAALYLNIKALKAERLIKADRNGREITYSLAEPSVAASKRRKPVAAESVKASLPVPMNAITASVVVAYVPEELHAALNGLTQRLAPIHMVGDKLEVLDHLVRTLPKPIAAVLASISDDLRRLSLYQG